jgi:hypothetical protein
MCEMCGGAKGVFTAEAQGKQKYFHRKGAKDAKRINNKKPGHSCAMYRTYKWRESAGSPERPGRKPFQTGIPSSWIPAFAGMTMGLYSSLGFSSRSLRLCG